MKVVFDLKEISAYLHFTLEIHTLLYTDYKDSQKCARFTLIHKFTLTVLETVCIGCAYKTCFVFISTPNYTSNKFLYSKLCYMLIVAG